MPVALQLQRWHCATTTTTTATTSTVLQRVFKIEENLLSKFRKCALAKCFLWLTHFVVQCRYYLFSISATLTIYISLGNAGKSKQLPKAAINNRLGAASSKGQVPACKSALHNLPRPFSVKGRPEPVLLLGAGSIGHLDAGHMQSCDIWWTTSVTLWLHRDQ